MMVRTLCCGLLVTLVGGVGAQVPLPENPGFTPEQAAAMETMMRNSKSSDVLYPKAMAKPARTRVPVKIDGKTKGRRWGGVGSAPSNAMGRMLQFYPEDIQNDILDYFFKPNFGMALTHLKVEVGGDNNSTSGTEPSFAHTREEFSNPDFKRGYLYPLMRAARDRNPAIELGALAWIQPYWPGNGAGRSDNHSFFTPESADYFVKFFEGARDAWKLEMQYFSPEQNERDPSGRRDWVVKNLRPAFDKAGFQHVKFVLDHDGWPLRNEDNDLELFKCVGALGRHYVENDPRKITTKEAQASGIPLWNAEGWSRVGEGWPLAIYFAESVARCYVDSKITQFTTWPLQAGGLPGCLYSTTGLMQANKPWSGFYQIYPTVWITAHFNQFAPMGWQTVDGGCGGLFCETNTVYDSITLGTAGIKEEWPRPRVNYLTLVSPDRKDYSIIVVNTSPFARTLDFEVSDLPGKPLHQWVSTEQDQFVNTGTVRPEDGKFTLGIAPWSICSLTTTTGQRKGQPKRPIPQDHILSLPYSDDFESYRIGADARYTHNIAGYFEVVQDAGGSKTLRQSVPAKGLTWAIPKDNYPCVAIGDVRWSDYEVSTQARLEGDKGDMALWARVKSFRDHGLGGYTLRVNAAGHWELGCSRTSGGPKADTYSEKTLAQGQIPDFKSDAWHTLAILVDGNRIKGSIDGLPVADIQDTTYAAGAVGYSTWAEGIQKDFFDMKAAMVIGLKYGQARFDNLLVRAVPGKLSQAGWTATAKRKSNVSIAELQVIVADNAAATRRIVVGEQATPVEQLAARELQRYLWQVSGVFLEIKTGGEVPSGSILMGQRQTNPLIDRLVADGKLKVDARDPGEQGYVLKHVAMGDGQVLVIAGCDAAGCLYGVYGLLEDHFGLTFGLAGDVLPDDRKSLDLPPLDERHAPAVTVRGILPWSNWPQTTTHYSWADWKSVIDQMAKMRMNMLMVHNYADELYHNVPIDGKLPRVYLPHTKTGYMIGHPAWVPWAYRFKGRDLVDDCSLGAESSLHGESLSNEEAYARGVAMFRRVIAYAHTRGVQIALGVDINDTVKGKGKLNDAQRAKLALEPDFVKVRVDQLINDYPELDYFVAFCSEGVSQFKDTAPEWTRAIRYIRDEFKKRAPGIKLAISGWGQRAEYIEGIPEDVIVAPIAPYKAYAQDGAIAGKRDFWAGPWMEKDNDDSMFYMPYRVLLSATVDSWQKRSANTKGLYALTWRNTDAIDAKFWYLARAPWDSQNKMKTAKDAYYAYAVANYGKAAADLVTPIINEKEAFACNMCEMGGPRPFREFATIMAARHEVNMKGFSIPAKNGAGYKIEAVKYHHRTGGGAVKAGTPGAYMQMSSGLCLEFRNVDFGEGAEEIRLELAASDGARVEARLDNEDGPLLGQAVVPKTKTGEDFTTVGLPVKPTKGKQIVVFNFSKEVYPRKELVKAEEQIAVVDRAMALASPAQQQRLDLLRTRLAAVRDHIRLNLEFPEYKLEDLPGTMESWVMNYIRRVDDISSLGTMSSIQNRFVQYTYLRNKVQSFYSGQAIWPPLDVEARGTASGAEVCWRDVDSSGKVTGYRVYRDGVLLTKPDLPVTQEKFMDEGSGEFFYTVTAVDARGKESLPSVKSRCLAGSADKDPPFIVMISPPLSGTAGQPAVVKARVIDNRSYGSISAALHYRQTGGKEWKSLPMTRRVRAVFTAVLTPEMCGANGVEYFVEATDGANTSRFPRAAPSRNLSLTLLSGPAPAELKPPVVQATGDRLTWQEASNAFWYRIYRGKTAEFKVGPESYLTYAAHGTTAFTDMEEDFDGTPREVPYYYRVTVMDRNGYESEPSPAVAVRSRIVLPLKSAVVQGQVQIMKLADALTTSGYVLGNFARAGDQIQFKNVPASSGLRIRYSNGGNGQTRCGLYVGGKRVATVNFPVTVVSDGVDNYADGVRLTTAKGAKGDWNTFAFMEVVQPVGGQIAFRLDADDVKANGGSPCCYLDRIELEPASTAR